jgi:Kef-type K+ transport system membrane component KefB/nucleotide-binding universal stress UspA family protein
LTSGQHGEEGRILNRTLWRSAADPAANPAWAWLLTLGLLLLPEALHAAEGGGGGGHSERIFLAQIVLLLVCGRLLGELMQRIGQPAVMGQLIAGILLGPSVLGALWPDLQHAIFPPGREQKAMLDAVSQLGILMLLLLTGMETDLSVVRRAKRAAISVSLAGISIPFVCGVVLGQFLPDWMLPDPERRLVTSLFLGTALSISSVKIVAMVVREMNFMRRTVGQVIVSAAIIDDTIGWIIIAVTFGLAHRGGLDLGGIAQSVLGTAIFLVVSFTVGRRIVFRLIRWANDNFVSEVPVITTIIVITGAMALITDAIGVHSVLGAFVAGMLVGQSPILTRHIDEQLRGLIVALFMPVFFGLAGLSANLAILENPSLLLLSVGFIAIASLGKFCGAFIGAALGGLNRHEALALACGMNARGSTEVIVATIGLSMGALGQDLYTMIVAMAVITTMAMPPTLRWALARLPMDEEEKARLEREEFEERGFVTRMERLLIAVDDSPSGLLASRIAGLLAGRGQLPTTVLHVGDAVRAPALAAEVESVVMAAAETSEVAAPEPGTAALGVEITTRAGDGPIEEAIARESRKGYDLFVVGVEPAAASGGEFDDRVARLVAEFAGPAAITVARGRHRVDPVSTRALRILVPVTGAAYSQRAAEVALALARAEGGSVLALHVSAGKRSWRRRLGVAWRGRGGTPEQALLRDICRIGEQLGVRVRTATRRNPEPEEAILRQMKLGGHDLIVMGVSPRPGPNLFFGDVPAAILERADRSVVFVAN